MNTSFPSKTLAILALFSVFFLSSCCLFTSQDCGCTPPEPDLSLEAKKWIAPYEAQAYFIFEDTTGQVDSFLVTRSSDTEFCGGEECGSSCQKEMATLQSESHSERHFSIIAKEHTHIIINNFSQLESLLFGELFTQENKVFSSSSSNAQFHTDFQWNGQPITALDIKCNTGSQCDSFEMQDLIISRDFGLIEFTTTDGRRWKKNN